MRGGALPRAETCGNIRRRWCASPGRVVACGRLCGTSTARDFMIDCLDGVFEPREPLHGAAVDRDLPALAARTARQHGDAADHVRRPRVVQPDAVTPEREPRVWRDRADVAVELERQRVE